MADISRAYFHFGVPAPPEPELVSYARSIFDDLDQAAEQALPFPDYDLQVLVEEGSLKGGGKVMVAAAALYFGIGQFGSFVQGVRELAALGKAVASQVVESARRDPLTEGTPLRWQKRDAGTVRRIERLFEKVRDRQLGPREATERTLELLRREDESLPPEAPHEIEEAFQSIRRNPKQLLLPLDMEEVPETPRVPPSQHKQPLPPPKRFLVEIRREGKTGEPEIKTKYR